MTAPRGLRYAIQRRFPVAEDDADPRQYRERTGYDDNLIAAFLLKLKPQTKTPQIVRFEGFC